MCECDEDYYEATEPEQIPGCPGWVIAKALKTFEPTYGEWHQSKELINSKSGFSYWISHREVFRGGKQDGFQFKVIPTNKRNMFSNPAL